MVYSSDVGGNKEEEEEEKRHFYIKGIYHGIYIVRKKRS